MIKNRLFTVLLLLTASIYNNCGAQPPSLTIDAGYRLPIGGGLLGTNNNNGTQTGVYGTYGQGLAFGGFFDAYIFKKFALDFGGHYWLGTAIKNTSTSGSGGITSSEIYNGKQNMVLLSMGCHYDFCSDTNKFCPYIGMGIDIGVGGNLKYTETVTSVYNNSTYQSITKSTITDGVAVGAYSALGVNYKLNPSFSLIAELKINTLSVMPDKAVITSLSENGVDVTGLLANKYKETDYVKNIPASYDPNDSTKPTQQIGAPFPLSSIGINIGIKYRFEKRNVSPIPD